MAITTKGRIEPLEAEADRTKGLGDWLQNVAEARRLGDPHKREAAHERLRTVYAPDPRDQKRALDASNGATGGWLMPRGVA